MTTLRGADVPRFDITDQKQEGQMLQYLNEHGYVVVASVANEDDINSAKNDFWDYFCKTNEIINPSDASTWDTDWPASSADGICSAKGFNHSRFLWRTRLLPAVKRAYGLIWDTEDLIVSYDTGNVFRPWQYRREWVTHGGWWHVDQNALKLDRQGRRCVQGLVTYYDANEHTGGLCVIPGSHHTHQEVCERSADGDRSMDYVAIKQHDPVLDNAGLLVYAKAGDLILWDSRTVHCNTPSIAIDAYYANAPATGAVGSDTESLESEGAAGNSSTHVDIIRLAAYVCMLPLSHANTRCLEQRKLAFVRRISTSHWPTQKIGINMKRVVEDPVEPGTCSDAMLALVGYSSEERRNLLGVEYAR
jgi:hypothetical protein